MAPIAANCETRVSSECASRSANSERLRTKMSPSNRPSFATAAITVWFIGNTVWPEFKVRVQAAYQAPSRAIARELAAGVVADYGREQERGVACFMDDFEACIAHFDSQ